MAKKYKAILSVLLVVLVIVSVITVTGVLDINKIVTEHESVKNPDKVVSYNEYFNTDTRCADRLMKTDIPDIFYTMTEEGEVSFYEVAEGRIKPVEETGVRDLEVTCSGQKLPASVHYIEKDGSTAGVGLFTNKLHPDVYLYDYAFFKLTDMFPAFKGKSGLLLLIDINKNRFYSDDKIFSESFYVYSSGKTEHFLSENQRIVGGNAMLRSDYKMFTSDIMDQPKDRVLFFSSRYYTAMENEEKIDILTSGGGGENVDNLKYVEDVLGLYFWRNENGTKYFAETETGFELRNFDGKETTKTVKAFEGNIKEDYIVKGNMILEIETGNIYDVVKEKEYKLDYSKFKMNFTPDLFGVSPEGKYCIVRGANNLKRPAVGVYNFETGDFYTYNDNIFGYVASMYVLDDGTMLLSVSNNESGTSYSQLVGIAGKKAEPIPEDEETIADGTTTEE